MIFLSPISPELLRKCTFYMITKNDIKHIRSLHQKKYRDLNEQFILEGEKIVNEAIKSERRISLVICTENLENNIHYTDIQVIKQTDFNKLSLLKTPSNVMAIMPFFEAKDMPSIKGRVVFAIDRIQDPGNLGTIIRICDWFGMTDLICSMDTVDLYNPKVVQASMGSLFRVNVHYVDLPEYLSVLSADNIPVFGALLNGKSIHLEPAPNEGIIVLGNESHGIRKEVINIVNEQITIPGKGDAESLNVAVSCGILANWAAQNQ